MPSVRDDLAVRLPVLKGAELHQPDGRGELRLIEGRLEPAD